MHLQRRGEDGRGRALPGRKARHWKMGLLLALILAMEVEVWFGFSFFIVQTPPPPPSWQPCQPHAVAVCRGRVGLQSWRPGCSDPAALFARAQCSAVQSTFLLQEGNNST